jgi:hypothetical protein
MAMFIKYIKKVYKASIAFGFTFWARFAIYFNSVMYKIPTLLRIFIRIIFKRNTVFVGVPNKNILIQFEEFADRNYFEN